MCCCQKLFDAGRLPIGFNMSLGHKWVSKGGMFGIAFSDVGMCEIAKSHSFSRFWHWAGKKALLGCYSAWPITDHVAGLELVWMSAKLQSSIHIMNVLGCSLDRASLYRTGTER